MSRQGRAAAPGFCVTAEIAGAALRPFRDTRPLLQGTESGSVVVLATQCRIADAALLPLMRQFAGVEPQWFAEAAYPRVRSWLEG